MTLAIRNGRALSGERFDITIEHGRIAASSPQQSVGEELDATGATMIPGLHDHHMHILATAARRSSVDLSECREEAAILRALAPARPAASVRAVGYDERAAGLPDAAMLDRWLRDRPLRVQDRTGALWALNSAAMALLPAGTLPPGAERDAAGNPTGRFWREDRWLGAHFPAARSDLAGLGRELAGCGVTGLTDAGPRNGPAEAATLGGAHIRGDLPQTLLLMGDETLAEGEGFVRGPLKLMIDERDPPPLAELGGRIATARRQGRAVAGHCVTAAELALFLAGLDEAGGARAGDRVEHGGVIADEALAVLAASPLTVVTNPAFVHDRGDRYRETIAPEGLGELYRAASLFEADIPVAAGSDAPYASCDPWLGMRTARDRLTAKGVPLGVGEALSAKAALDLYLGDPLDPGGPRRRLAVGEPGDLLLCEGSPADVLVDLTAERVRATVIAGRVVFSRA